MTHKDACDMLYNNGHENVAEYLRAWRNIRGTLWGWDGHLRRKWPGLWDFLIAGQWHGKAI